MPAEYYSLTFNELDCLLDGFRENRLNQLRIARKHLTLLYNVNVPKKDRKTEEEYWSLEDDETIQAQQAKPMTPPDVFIGVLKQTLNLKTRGS